MELLKEIGEFYTFASLLRFDAIIKSPRSYRRVEIVQKNGKSRIVYVPCKIVKMAQQYVLDRYLSQIKYSPKALAYTRGKSIIDVAIPHLENNFFLHLDIKHFFDSMSWDVLKGIVGKYFKKNDFNKKINDIRYEDDLKNILTFRGIIRQGSVTAPYLSNIYLYEFDLEMDDIVKKLTGGVYTRYSDDIFISSQEKIGNEIVAEISTLLKCYKLRLNWKKILFKTLRDSVSITGITLTKDKRLVLNTSFKKKIKKMIYLTLKNGKPPISFKKVYGYLYYLMMCDPVYFDMLQTKYSKDGMYMLDAIKQIEKEN